MIPDTKNGLPAMACVSAMQKAIRRGLEREAMEFAGRTTLDTSKAFHSIIRNRLDGHLPLKICDTSSPRRGSCRSSPPLSRSRKSATSKIGEGRLGDRQHHSLAVPVAEVPRGLPLRRRHRAAVDA